jgi:GDPmannose 4,6-dehydratase
MKTALILGVNGQDGSFLAEFLLEKGYRVIGWMPDSVEVTLENIQGILDKIEPIKGNLLSQDSLNGCLEKYRPDEVYNLAAPSFPAASWNTAVQTGDIVGLGVVRCLEAIRHVHPRAHFYQASSSEIFGNPNETPQNEMTPFQPRNPYGMAKLFAHWATVNYRQRYGLYAVSGILFNHESARRPVEFVTRKISQKAARIKAGLDDRILLGNLDAQRDWGYAGDFVEAMWKMLNQANPQDFVIGTGKTHSVRDFLGEAFSYLSLDWQDYVQIDPNLVREEEGMILRSDPALAQQVLGWHAKVQFRDLVRMMVNADLKLIGMEPPEMKI